jgi:uroporphyrinogen decarboxylase
VNSRERVLTALDHREPDRVPITFGVPVYSSIWDAEPFGYRALCDALGITDYAEPVIFPDSHSVENADQRLLDRFGADLRWVCAGTDREAESLPDGHARDPWMGLITTQAGIFVDVVNEEAPLRGATEIAELEAYPYWPGPELIHEPAIAAGKAEAAKAAQDAGYAVVAIPGATTQSIFHVYDFLRGFDTRLMDMHDDPRFYHVMVDRITEIDEQYLEEFLTPIGPYVDLICMGEDLGTQRAPFMSLSDYRRFCKPYQKRWIDAAKRCAPNARLVLHSCGAVRDYIPDFIDIGVQVLNPIQPKAAGMDAAGIKRDFGDALSFIGGFDIQELLPFGTAEEIRDGARRLIDAMAPGGGFIFAPSHQILPDVPPANVIAMYDAALEFAGYS